MLASPLGTVWAHGPERKETRWNSRAPATLPRVKIGKIDWPENATPLRKMGIPPPLVCWAIKRTVIWIVWKNNIERCRGPRTITWVTLGVMPAVKPATREAATTTFNPCWRTKKVCCIPKVGCLNKSKRFKRKKGTATHCCFFRCVHA